MSEFDKEVDKGEGETIPAYNVTGEIATLGAIVDLLDEERVDRQQQILAFLNERYAYGR